jgi:AbrB family looped-hinge helix DNA binding protein
MALVRMLRGGQFTLPAEARKELNLSEGDYLDVEIAEGVVTLKPVTVLDRAAADRRLTRILSRVKYTGPEPEPGEDEVMDMVAGEVHSTRRKYAKGRTR